MVPIKDSPFALHLLQELSMCHKEGLDGAFSDTWGWHLAPCMGVNGLDTDRIPHYPLSVSIWIVY